MKRLCTAVLLLLGVIASGWYNFRVISDTVDSISNTLVQATLAVEQDKVAEATQLLQQAHTVYLDHESYLSAVMSEKLLDEVRLGFARCEQSLRNGKPEDQATELADVRQAVDDLLRSEAVSLGNIL